MEIHTVSVHDALFGRVASNLEVGQPPRAAELRFADFRDSKTEQVIADPGEPARRGMAAEYLGPELGVVVWVTIGRPTSSACRPPARLRLCCIDLCYARRVHVELPVPLGACTLPAAS